VIVRNLNLGSSAIRPGEANPELIVDADAVLAIPVAFQRFQAVAGEPGKVHQAAGLMQLVELPSGGSLDRLKPLGELIVEQPLGFSVPERTDHLFIVYR
jgi:hypothetical protein